MHDGAEDRLLTGLVGSAVAVGLALRLAGLDFGLPFPQARPDEGILLHRALSVAGGDLNPHFFNYPSLHIYLTAAVSGALFVVQWLVGAVDGPRQFVLNFVVDPTVPYLAGRSLSVIAGVVTIPLCGALARRLAGPWAGVSACWFLAVAFLHVRDSHFLTVDVPATAWGTAALWLLVESSHRRCRRWLWAGAVCFGLAVSTKYNLALLGLCLPIAARAHHPSDRAAALTLSLRLGAASVGAFFVTSPFVLLDAPTFWAHLTFEADHFATGHGVEAGNGWFHHLTVSMRHGLGWPLLVFALAGFGHLGRQRDPVRWLVVAPAVTYFLVAGAGNTLFVRYALPMIPLACIAAACWIVHLTRGQWRIVMALTALLGCVPLSQSIQHVRLMARTDSRVVAGAWIEEHLPDGATIAIAGTDYARPHLRPTPRWLTRRLRDVRAQGGAGARLEAMLQLPADTPRFELLEVRARNPLGFQSVVPAQIDSLLARGAQYLLVPVHPLDYAAVDAQLLAQVEDRPSVWDLSTSHCERSPVYDGSDAYFLPLHHTGCISRPGPGYRLIRLLPDPARVAKPPQAADI